MTQAEVAVQEILLEHFQVIQIVALNLRELSMIMPEIPQHVLQIKQ